MRYIFLILSTMLFTTPTIPADEIQSWPKIELHLHMDCSLSFKAVHQLDPSITPEIYQAEFIAPERCLDLADYIKRAIREVDLMQTKEALRIATLDMFDQLQQDNIIYAEIRFAPLQHLKKGLTPTEVVSAVDEAVTEGSKKTGIKMGVILCTLRHYSKDQSMETVRLVEKFKNTHIVGFDIAASEAGFPIDNHIAAFQYAHQHNIPCTAHAGEAKGPGSVIETLDNFHPSRIGHGVRSIENPGLVQRLKKENILLECCPTSNLQTNMYPDIPHHPIDSLYRAGVPLNVNTDCRTISKTTVSDEYRKIIQHFGWTKKDFLTCNLQAVDHAFTSPAEKEKLKKILRRAYSKSPYHE